MPYNGNDLEVALQIARIKYDYEELRKEKKDNLKPAIKDIPAMKGIEPFGALYPLTLPENDQLDTVRDLIVRYVTQTGHERPLCLAIFGSPGSGKSFTAKQIQAVIKDRHKIDSHLTVVNLTQLSTPYELTSAIIVAQMTAAEVPGRVPVILFDEFDTTGNGAAYGWLSSFLAPMHDGEFFHDGRIVKLKTAIYMFAGGTAFTMQEFSDKQMEPSFREAKGPDFISRLRGYLDIPGPNQHRHVIRRALVFRHEMVARVIRHGKGSFDVDEEFLTAFLKAGRFRHGARSIAALIELSKIEDSPIGWGMLPEDAIVKLQVDRGPLDKNLIGGAIALSGFDPESKDALGKSKATMVECWKGVVQQLWDEGATVAFAGLWGNQGAGRLVLEAINELHKVPPELRRLEATRNAPPPRYLSFGLGLNAIYSQSEADSAMPPEERKRIGLEFNAHDYLTKEERESLEPWAQRAIERARRRWAVTEASVARFVIGGSPHHRGGRPSGVVEEVVQSLALGHPVYVAGGFPGVTEDIGVVLGLSRIQTSNTPIGLNSQLSPERRTLLESIANRLRPPPFISLPVLPDEQVAFLREHAIHGPKWPCNGLSLDDNRRLFESSDQNEVSRLIIKGLIRVFAKR
jgi:hypothetical protein